MVCLPPRPPACLNEVEDASLSFTEIGGFAFLPGAPSEVWLVSVGWPPWVREALAANARTRAAKVAEPLPELSMPSAELFGSFAVPSLVIEASGFSARAICAVGDCAPAAGALSRGTSSKAPMRSLLLEARELTERWLGVAVPRDYNVDADRLSHPSMLGEVVADAVSAGLVPRVITNAPGFSSEASVSEAHPLWRALQRAIAASLA